MASRELVGRPLVPFFDADDNLNAALAVDASSAARESLDVDARVWNKELGYFEYPSEPIAIPDRQEAARTLLTPAMMLSSSCPEPSAALGGAGAAASSAPGSNGRSSSSKRGAKQKRAATPNAKSSGKQSATESAGDAAKAGRKRSGKAGKPKGKEELSAAGKWAWSAFQSSPDPNELPLPPFLAKSAAPAPPAPPPLPPTDPLMYPASPPRTYSQVAQGITPPFQPPLPPNPPPEEPMSIELSMTQDLRRMLNIGGG